MESIKTLIDKGDYAAAKSLMQEYDLVIRDGVIVPRNEIAMNAISSLKTFWNQRQQTRKILLNSLYGALLNPSLRFNDDRLGQSTTLTGRCVVQHMNAKTNEVVLGIYDYQGEVPHYSDTDSCYFTVAHLLDRPMFEGFEPTRDNYLALYDAIASEVNASFASFMHRTFNTSMERGAYIRAGRELVGVRAYFIKKKKYAILMYEMDGTRFDVNGKRGKLKAMGLDLKRADTPKVMQDFLSEVLMDTLTGATHDDITNKIIPFRQTFKSAKPWEKGKPSAVKGMTKYYDAVNRSVEVNKKAASGINKRVTVPAHVGASYNWNKLCELHNDLHTPLITDGTRIVICSLLPNEFGMKDVAYPIDIPSGQLPKWFTGLPFDDAAMEDKIIDMKLQNLFEALDWNFTHTHLFSGDEYFTF